MTLSNKFVGRACFVFFYDMDTFLELASKRAIHWFDVAFFSGLIALSGGADSLFFLFLFFIFL